MGRRKELREIIKTTGFAEGCVRLWEDQAANTRSYRDWKCLPSVECVESVLNSIHVRFCSTLTTHLRIHIGRVTREVGERDTVVYVVGTPPTIYISGGGRVEAHLARGILKALNGAIKGVSRLENPAGVRTMLEVENSEGISMALDKAGVLTLDKKAVLRGMPGQALTPEDAKLIKLQPLRIFAENELIAIGSNGDYRYGRVLSQTKDAFDALSYLTVDVGLGKKESLISSQVFIFTSNLNSNISAKDDPKEPVSPVTPNKGDEKVDSKSGELKDEGSIRRMEKGHIDHKAALVSAVSSILTRVNLPLSLEQKDLISANIQMQNQLRELKTQITSLADAKDKANEQLKKIEESFQCQICTSNPVDRVLIPCGHLLCSTCVGRLRRNNCPFCRQPLARSTRSVKYYSPLEEGSFDGN
mmetsp:Transcript_32127/g.51731  ORF Transcript_32127/g.51731 Transcript_32127/m.51731 type:complete len:416 (-) Transcript_32127:142-1389(-)